MKHVVFLHTLLKHHNKMESTKLLCAKSIDVNFCTNYPIQKELSLKFNKNIILQHLECNGQHDIVKC